LVDDHTWEFKLAEGGKVSQRGTLECRSRKVLLERCKTHPKSQYKYAVPDYRRSKPWTKHTVHFITKTPTPEVLVMLESISINAPQVDPGVDKKDHAYLARNMVGTGAYKFVEWVKDDRITLAYNKDWWGGRVDYEKVVLRPHSGERHPVARS